MTAAIAVVLGLACCAVAYVLGLSAGARRVPDPAQCRDKQLAAETSAVVWQRRAKELEDEVYGLRAAAAEHARAETAAVTLLLEELDQQARATYAPVHQIRDLGGAAAI